MELYKIYLFGKLLTFVHYDYII